MSLIIDVPWTKLKKDAIWGHVSVKYMEPPGRLYHNMAHVVDLYKYADLLKIPHNIDLDLAILYHDIIYDSGDNKEIRSSYAFANMINNFSGKNDEIPEKVMLPFGVVNPLNVIDAILATVSHAPIGDDTDILNIIILLDLYGFAKEKTRKQNFVNLINEIDVLYPNVDRLEVYKNVAENLLRIYGNIVFFIEYSKNNNVTMKYEKEWNEILSGIAKQIDEINAIYKLETELREKGSK